jgi:DUF4097 and DUF4098 domain-containing protein YvlB
MKKLSQRIALGFLLIGALGAQAFAQKDGRDSLACRDWQNGTRANHCEIKEQTLPAAGGQIKVDGRQNGGVSIKGWEKSEVLVRSRIQTSAPSQAEADALANQIVINTGGSNIFASGPESRKDFSWSVSFEVFVPRRSDLSLQSHNGGISISDVHGQVDFQAVNGGVVLSRVGGNVHGGTMNGGLVVQLTGDRWDGDGLDVKTTNGGIVMTLPSNYSARLETGTVNGSLKIGFPVTVQGDVNRELAVNLGSGGPTIRVKTTNGGVRINHTELAF